MALPLRALHPVLGWNDKSQTTHFPHQRTDRPMLMRQAVRVTLATQPHYVIGKQVRFTHGNFSTAFEHALPPMGIGMALCARHTISLFIFPVTQNGTSSRKSASL